MMNLDNNICVYNVHLSSESSYSHFLFPSWEQQQRKENNWGLHLKYFLFRLVKKWENCAYIYITGESHWGHPLWRKSVVKVLARVFGTRFWNTFGKREAKYLGTHTTATTQQCAPMFSSAFSQSGFRKCSHSFAPLLWEKGCICPRIDFFLKVFFFKTLLAV